MMHILLLEDNKLDAKRIEKQLQTHLSIYSMERCRNLSVLKEKILNDEFVGLVLLNLKLIDGVLPLFKEIIMKKNGQTAMVLLAEMGSEDTALALLEAGADDYILKTPGYLSKMLKCADSFKRKIDETLLKQSDIVHILFVKSANSSIDPDQQFSKKGYLTKKQTKQEVLNFLRQTPFSTHSELNFIVILEEDVLTLTTFDFIKTIRQELNFTIPILLVISAKSEESAIAALRIGVDDYVVKGQLQAQKMELQIGNLIKKNKCKKRLHELIKSESKYRLLAEHSGDVIFMLDMDLHYTYISPAVMDLRGFLPEEILSLHASHIMTNKSYEKVCKIIPRVLNSINMNFADSFKQITVELEMICKDKTTIWTEVKASLVLNEDKKPIGILGVTRDISKRMYAIEELRKLSRAVEQSPISIVITDTKGIIEYVNPKFSEITGYSLTEVKGKAQSILKSGLTENELYQDMWNALSNSEDWKGELCNKRKDGSFFWEQISISPIKNEEGTTTHFLTVKEDISDKKSYQEMLLKAKEKAEESDQLKTSFLHNIAHEIRTPLNAIVGFSDFIKDPELSSDKIAEFAEIISSSSNQLLRIITDIITISTIENGQEKTIETEININNILEFIIERQSKKSKEKNVPLFFHSHLNDKQALILTDENKLLQILSNVIENAIKFTSEGEIRIECKLEEYSLMISVEDTGIGIPHEVQSSIFMPFRKVESNLSQLHGGTGLGLTISKAYTELIGGEIWFKSEPKKGSTFFIKIPYKHLTSQNESNLSQKEVETTSSKKKILVAEDNIYNFMLITEYLSKFKYTLIHAENGIQAIEACKENPDLSLIIMDIKMPHMDGLEAAKRIYEFMPDIPILIQTAYIYEYKKPESDSANIYDILSKPIKQQDFIEKVQSCLRL